MGPEGDRHSSLAAPSGPTRRKRLITGIAGSALSRILSALGPLLTIPVAFQQLGAAQYGAWSAAISLTAFVAFADLGLGAGLMTRLSEALAAGDARRAKVLVSTAYTALGTLSVLLVSAVAISSFTIDYSSIVGGQAGQSANSHIVVVTLCVFAASVATSLVVRVQYATQQIASSNLWQSAGSVSSVAVAYLAAHLGVGGAMFVALVAGTPLLWAILNTAHFFVNGRGREFRPSFDHFDRDVLRELAQLGSGFLVINLLMAAALSTDNLVIGKAVGLEAVPEYAISARIFAFLALATYIFSGPLWPMNVEALAQGNTRWVLRTSRTMSVLSGTTAIVLATIVIALGPQLMSAFIDPALQPSRWLLAGLGSFLILQAFTSPIFMVLNASKVLAPQIVGYALLLTAIPLKWVVAKNGHVELVPWCGAILYLLIFTPCLAVGYRRALTNAATTNSSHTSKPVRHDAMNSNGPGNNVTIYHAGKFQQFSAGALRTVTLTKSLTAAGFQVTIISADIGPGTIAPDWATEHLGSTTVICGGKAAEGPLRRLPKRMDPFAMSGESPHPDYVILFGATPPTYKRAERVAAGAGAPLILDMDEWMGPRDFSLLSWLSLFPLRYEFFMRRLPRRINCGLAISQLMTRYLARHGAAILHVPPLHEVIRGPGVPTEGNLVRVLLPGVSQRALGKDRLSLELVADAFAYAPELVGKIQLHVMGVNDDPNAIARLQRLRSIGLDVVEHGRVPLHEAHRILRGVDWLVVLRSENSRRLRYAFPSKATESLVAGTPLIANRFGDIETALRVPEEAILVEDLNPQSVANALTIATRSVPRRSDVQIGAARFTPSYYAAPLRQFLTETRNSNKLR